ncbi:MAG TPA: 50S ribosomal protein L14 [Candidatus Pacearchaeota archaeon]|nr:MAG: 50S ribosomal protein L14 [Candidatus Yanofskybacteria bacterium]HNR80819.1 50S ribosomal protein L14 [Candidatus Pacearchaeota archaeon]HPO06388.1 50S ribosomal protein L14 [Candidatus Pacearchaeota archaeon]
MIQLRTMLKVADNSGAKMVQCFHVAGGTRRRYAAVGDVIMAAVKIAEPRKPVKKHDKVRAVVIRQKKEYRREDGTYIRFDDNACVILEGKGKEPKGGRIFGPVAKELKARGYDKIAAMAEELI